MAQHSLTLRLDDRHFELLGRLAEQRGVSRADVLRSGLEREGAAVVREREFQVLLDRVLDEHSEALDLLA